ncbi:Basic secretory protein [Quillaja saponaria]|uniref:Basic secretory protein n=1 Tax=Quillaja saponaria TaxID=32244 RepID=A0AAD7KUL8_QUISA|nr:Basic secretory protein [Quillaja saponaria]
MAYHSNFFFYILTTLVIFLGLQGTQAVEYVVTNQALTTEGGVRFRNELGAEYVKQRMAAATQFIWTIFNQNTQADRKNVQVVNLIVENREGIAVTIGNGIHIGANYIQGIKGDIKTDFNGVLYHEMTHIWQWYDKNPNIVGGIADYVRLKANYIPGHWVKPGGGERWNQGYDVTARFLEYCESLRNGFVAELNKKMRTSFDVNYFEQLLGKTVDQLWKDLQGQVWPGLTKLNCLLLLLL